MHNIKYINKDSYEKEVLESGVPVIVDFYSEDCPPCEVLSPIYNKMAEKYGEHIKFIKILRQDNRELAKSINVSGSPTVLFYKDGKEIGERLNGFLNKPTVRKAIEGILGDVLPKEEMKKKTCDVLVLGGGAAGLTASLYSSRANLSTILVDEGVPGGQTATTYHVENYPGTEGSIHGKYLTENIKKQALSFGTEIDDLKEIFEVKLDGELKYIKTEDTEYYAKTIIIATGAEPRPLPAKNAREFKGRGIHYCATCDGSMYEDRKIVVVGGGNSAVEEAIFLTRFASHITIVHQFDHFQATKKAASEAFDNEKIDIIWDSEVREVNGEGHALKNLVIENIKTGKMSTIDTEGAFVYIGTQPRTENFKGSLDMDDWNYIKAEEDTITNIPGIFAAGDVRTKPVRQIVTAASDGAVAGVMAERYLSGQ